MPLLALLVLLAAPLAGQERTGAGLLTPSPARPQYLAGTVLHLGWNEGARAFSVALQNPSPVEPMRIDGVQSTAGLYVVSFPDSLPTSDQAKTGEKGSGRIALVYEPADAAGEGAALVRLKTNLGDKVIPITVEREPAVIAEATALRWAVGETPAAKFVQLKVVPGTTVPTGVKVFGDGGKAVLEPGDRGSYTLKVTPTQTTRATTFPVMVLFEPALKGATLVVNCTVAAAKEVQP